MANQDLFSDHSANQANLGFEGALWTIADKFRGHLEVSQYKHIVLGLLFLRLVSHPTEVKQLSTPRFRFPKNASWDVLVATPSATLCKALNAAFSALEAENPVLRGLFPQHLITKSLREDVLFDVVRALDAPTVDLRRKDSIDILGRVYEYFLAEFARAEGSKGGEYYTPHCVVELLVRMLAPFKGTVYDPCCGSGGMFIQSQEFVRLHGGREADIHLYGQESNLTTWRLARMNLLLHGLASDLGDRNADSFRDELHPDLKANYILANPPFNQKDWSASALTHDPRWQYGLPPNNSANYAWIQHIVSHLAPNGYAGFVLANGSLSSNTGGDDEIRKRLVDADLVDCVVALPHQLFYSTPIPCCLWFISKDKTPLGRSKHRGRTRSGETLFIDGRRFGVMTDRTHRELTHSEIARIADSYASWRGIGTKTYSNVSGFCRSATIPEISSHRYALVPGRYVGFTAEALPEFSPAELRGELRILETHLKSVSKSADDALALIRALAHG